MGAFLTHDKQIDGERKKERKKERNCNRIIRLMGKVKAKLQYW
jgi:hypothetical protein